MRLALLAVLLLCGTGCSLFQPTLKAVPVRSVPFPNGRIETAIWDQAPELRVAAYRRAAGIRERRDVKLRAIHDGQAISILATWVDETQTLDRVNYLWNEKTERYDQFIYLVDQFAIEWPLSENPSFCMLGDREEKYDLWSWKAGWTNFSGYADDMQVLITPHPTGTKPEDVLGELYPRRDGQGLVEVQIVPDSGKAATFLAPVPERRKEARAAGVATDYPRGSAGDVQAFGVYSKEIVTPTSDQIMDTATPGYWYHEQMWRYREPSWFVEFYRLFTTAYPEEDYQIKPKGENRFAISIHNQSDKGDHYTTGPIRLKVMPLGKLK